MFLFDVFCIKRAITYSIVNSFINIISKAVIKCSYEDDNLTSKVITTFFLYLYLKASKLIRKCLDIVDVVQQVTTSLHLASEQLAPNEDNVAQPPCFKDFTKGLPYIYQSFTTPYVRKLNAMMDIAFFTCLWYSFFIFGSAFKGGTASKSSTMPQMFTEANPIFNLKSELQSHLQILKFSLVNLSINLAPPTLRRCHLTLKD